MLGTFNIGLCTTLSFSYILSLLYRVTALMCCLRDRLTSLPFHLLFTDNSFPHFSKCRASFPCHQPSGCHRDQRIFCDVLLGRSYHKGQTKRSIEERSLPRPDHPLHRQGRSRRRRISSISTSTSSDRDGEIGAAGREGRREGDWMCGVRNASDPRGASH